MLFWGVATQCSTILTVVPNGVWKQQWVSGMVPWPRFFFFFQQLSFIPVSNSDLCPQTHSDSSSSQVLTHLTYSCTQQANGKIPGQYIYIVRLHLNQHNIIYNEPLTVNLLFSNLEHSQTLPSFADQPMTNGLMDAPTPTTPDTPLCTPQPADRRAANHGDPEADLSNARILRRVLALTIV